MAKTAAGAADKWAKNYTNSGADFEAGIRALTESPMEKAIAQKEAMVAAWQEAISSGKWENALRSINFNDWKEKTIRLGKQRMAEGAREGKVNFQKFMEFWLPVVAQLKERLRSLPRGTAADNKARMNAAFDFFSEQDYRKRA